MGISLEYIYLIMECVSYISAQEDISVLELVPMTSQEKLVDQGETRLIWEVWMLLLFEWQT